RSGRGSFEAVAVDAGRIAVLEPTGAVRIVRADGSLVHRLVLPEGQALAAQLSGSQLVVLTAAALKVYDAATGAAKKTLPLGADVDNLADLELERRRFLARDLGREAGAVVADELDAHLEAEVDEPLDHRLLRRPVRVGAQLEVVRPDERVAHAVDRPDEAHHE